MIIFNLDGTLADFEPRRHFVERSYILGCDHWHQIPNHPVDMCDSCKKRFKEWKPDWKSFYEACDKDAVIIPIKEAFIFLWYYPYMRDIQIWSGRCESDRDKTIKWLDDEIFSNNELPEYIDRKLKMRPIGDSTPEEVLKERWYDLHNVKHPRDNIEMVFESCPKCIRMWKRRGVFVFNCCQDDEEF